MASRTILLLFAFIPAVLLEKSLNIREVSKRDVQNDKQQHHMKNDEFYDSFMCSNGVNIERSKICNGIDDCGDRSDEINCDYLLCKQPLWFLCNDNRTCVKRNLLCNQRNDCPLGDDEENCDKTTEMRECGHSEYTCKNKMCVSMDVVCDGRNDCLDGTDETAGCSDIQNNCKGFVCKNGRCLESFKWQCDGVDDCSDGSDEHECKLPCTIENHHYDCGVNSTCITIDKVCDGKMDCPNNKDEGGLCSDKINTCNNLTCINDCKMTPTGPVCICPFGFKFNHSSRVCEDINECETYGICSQICENTKGSYHCKCVNKFRLKKDGKSCVVTGGEALLLYTTQKAVGGVYLESNHHYQVANDLSQVIGVAYDGLNIFWTDITHRSESIIKALEDGSKREIIVSSGLGAPEDICVDYLTGNIYFTDSMQSHIAMCSNDGKHCTILLNENVHRPRGIVLNPKAGLMYWTDWGDKPMIGIAAMDGRGSKPFITKDIHWPNCLALDLPNNRLYWADAKHQRIESVYLNGNDRRIVISEVLKHPYGIAIFENKLYWSDWDTQNIQACDKFTGKNRQVVVRDQTIYDVHIYHSALNKRENHACLSHKCSHMCLLSLNNTFSCACPPGMTIGPNKFDCQDSVKKQTLLLGIGNYLVSIEHKTLGRNEAVNGESLEIFINKMAFNSLTGEIFIADNIQRAIFVVNLKTKHTQELISRNIGNISALAFDYLGNNLYWADQERSTVEVFSLKTNHRAVVQHFLGTDQPVALALIPENGQMMIALNSYNHTHIDQVVMHGRGVHSHVVEASLGASSFQFAVDQGLKSIFFTDRGRNKIEIINFSGDDRHMFRANVRSPVSLAIIGDDLYWTSYKSRRLYWANKHRIGVSKRVSIEKPPFVTFPDEMTLLATQPLKIIQHPCQSDDNAGCSHICVPINLRSAACLCPPGMVFEDSLYKKCIDFTDCEFRCTSGECVTSSRRCNGHKDCVDGSDEVGCDTKDNLPLECNYDEFRCENGQSCIHQNRRCDMHSDCTDGSDEKNCENFNSTTKCHKLQHACPDGRCIDLTALCDGIRDCLDGSDEINCYADKSSIHSATTCGSKMFRCSSGQCIDATWECDGFVDCTDSSDEHNQCLKMCPKGTVRCQRGHCIDLRLICDGHNDCGDNTDEENCIDHGVRVQICNDDQFQCNSDQKICLPEKAKCNGTAECPRGEDEANCTRCNVHEFECATKNKCIRMEWVCDAEKDCEDGSDEQNCLDFNRKNKTLNGDFDGPRECSAGMFDCKDGSCIDMWRVCDNNNDCGNGIDESGQCNTSCTINPCDQKCHPSPFGPICECSNGFFLGGDGRRCLDIDECKLSATQAPPCSQICTNTKGSFHCSCYPGFMLRSDKVTCKALGKSRKILFSSFDQIRQLSQSPPSLTILMATNGSRVSGMDANIPKNILYLAFEDAGVIYSLNMTNGNLSAVINIGSPGRLACDWITDNVYFIDTHSGDPSIKVCHLSKEACVRLIRFRTADVPKSIAIDSVNRILFYSVMHYHIFRSSSSAIYRTSLDGTRSTLVVTDNLVQVTAIACDPNKKMLYYTDAGTQSLQAIFYDGTGRWIIIKSNSAVVRPIALNIFQDMAVIMNMGVSEVTKCKLYGNRECHSFQLSVYNSEELVVLQDSRQPTGSDICANSNCTLLCVQAPLGPRCVCHGGIYVRPGEKCSAADANNLGIAMNPQVHDIIGDIHMDHGGHAIVTPDTKIDSSSTSISAAKILSIIFLILCVGLGVGYYYYKKKISHGKFNISMHFHNPSLKTMDTSEVTLGSSSVSVQPQTPCVKPIRNSTLHHNELILETHFNKIDSDGLYTSCEVDEFNDDPESRLIN